MERSQKLCVTSYFENRTNLEIQELIHTDINRDLVDKFDYTIITEHNTVLIEENQTIYEIIILFLKFQFLRDFPRESLIFSTEVSPTCSF
jgi:hypothetical protein